MSIQGYVYLNFLSQTLEQCANANDTSLPLSLCVNRMVNAHSFYDVKICEQKFEHLTYLH